MVSGKLTERQVHIDARGQLCPFPVIHLQDKMKSVEHGTEITIVATDPGVLEDIPMWCRVNGHEHLESREDEKEYFVRVKAQKE